MTSSGGARPTPRVAAIGLADGAGFITRPVPSVRFAHGGIAGDCHAGPVRAADARAPWVKRGTPIANTRQISLLSVEELAEIAHALGIPAASPHALGANLVTAGIHPLSALPPATRLCFAGGATLFITEENLPCATAGRSLAAWANDPSLQSRFVRAATGRRGLVAMVEAEGTVSAGDAITIIAPAPRRLPRPVRTQ